MCDAPIGTTSWSPAKKRNGFKEVDVSWGREGIVTILQANGLPKETATSGMLLYNNMKTMVRSAHAYNKYFDIVNGIL